MDLARRLQGASVRRILRSARRAPSVGNRQSCWKCANPTASGSEPCRSLLRRWPAPADRWFSPNGSGTKSRIETTAARPEAQPQRGESVHLARVRCTGRPRGAPLRHLRTRCADENEPRTAADFPPDRRRVDSESCTYRLAWAAPASRVATTLRARGWWWSARKLA